MDAPRLPGVAVSPLRDVMALVSRRSMPPIAELARPWLGLAGSRIDPANNGPRGAPDGTGITLRTIATGVELKVQVPPDAQIGLVGFSPDGKRLAFTNTRDTRIDAAHRRRRDGSEPHRRWRIEHGRGRMRVVDGQLRAAVPLRGGRSRRSASSARLAIRSEHPGEPRASGSDSHVPGPVDERARRSAVRVLRLVPTCLRRRGHRTPLAARQAGHRQRRDLTGWPVRARVESEASVLAAAHLGAVPARCGSVESTRREGSHARGCADGRYRADQRCHHRASSAPLGAARRRHAHLGRGARQGRHSKQGAAPRQDSVAERAVHRRAGGSREDAVSIRRRELDRYGNDPADRKRSRHANHAHVGAERALGRTAQVVGPQTAGQLQRSWKSHVPPWSPDDPAGWRRDLFERPWRVAGRRSPVPRPAQPAHVRDRATVPQRYRRLRVGRRSPGRGRRTRADAQRDENAATELFHSRPRCQDGTSRHPVRRPAPAAHQGDGRPDVRDLQAEGWRGPERHHLSPCRLPEGPACPDARVGVSAGVRRSSRCQSGRGVAEPLHERDWSRHTFCC